MARVAPIRMNGGSRALWFDPGDLDIRKGDPVVVLTARGVEFGTAADEIMDVSDEEIGKLKSPLKPVKRLATPEDEEQACEMARLSAEALPVFKQLAAESEVEMRPISVEYLLDGDKAVFYFEAEERVDFRDLVRKLAAHFHVRVDMRQIGVRDEARMVGGLGHCGQELCCKRLGGEFCPVSIRMAKEQDLSLNPQKISGVCGRLMCCLRYEYDAYKDFKSRAPKANATVQTPEGPAKVVDLDVPREVVSLKVGDEKPVKVPLCDFEPAEEGARPNRVGSEAWERASAETNMPSVNESSFLTSQFTGSDKLAEAGSVRRTGAAKAGRAAAPAEKVEAASGRKPRRRRSTKVGEGAAAAVDAVVSAASGTKGKQKQTPAQKQDSAEKAAPKKRQRSRGGRSEQQSAQGAQNAQGQKSVRGAQGQQNQQGDSRQDKKNARQGAASGKRAEGASRRSGKVSSPHREADAATQASSKQGPRPGQKSSGLRNRAQAQADQGAGQNRNDAAVRRQRAQAQPVDGSAKAAESLPAGEGATHRRTRRRSHKAGSSGEQQ